MLNGGSLDYIELKNVLPKDFEAEYIERGTEKCKLLSKSLEKELENLDDLSCPEIQWLVESDEQMWICCMYPFRHQTILHCAERIAKKFGELKMQQLKL